MSVLCVPHTCIDPLRPIHCQQVLPREPQMLSSSPCVTMVIGPFGDVLCLLASPSKELYTKHTLAGWRGWFLGEAGACVMVKQLTEQSDRLSCCFQSVSLHGGF